MEELVEPQPLLENVAVGEGSYSTMHHFITMQRELQERDMDSVVPITGFKGLGKSTLGLQIAKHYLDEYYPDISFQKDMEKFVCYNNGDLYRNLMEGTEMMPVVADEAVRFMMAEDWGKLENREMKKTFAQVRTKKRVILPCIPDFFWLDRKYREDMVYFWIHIVARGIAIIFTADMKVGVDDKWHRKEFQKLSGRITIFSPYEEVVKIYRKHPCFLDVFKFPKLEQDTYAKYLKLRTKKIFEEASMATPKDKLWKLKCAIYNIKEDEKFKWLDMSKMLYDPKTKKPLFDTSTEVYGFLQSIRKEMDNYIGMPQPIFMIGEGAREQNNPAVSSLP